MKKALLILLAFVLIVQPAGCSEAAPGESEYDAFAECLDCLFVVPGMDEEDFISTMQAIVLENGKSVYQAGQLYTKTSLHSDGYAFGDRNNTAEYSIENKDRKITKNYSVYISSDAEGVVYPEKVKYGDSFKTVLSILKLAGEYKTAVKEAGENGRPNFETSNEEKTKTIGAYFKGWHGRATNTKIETADVTLYYRETTEKPDNGGKTRTYSRSVNLHFSGGTLRYFSLDLYEEYDSAGEPEINNDKVGIKYTNPEYAERATETIDEKYQMKTEEIYHKDKKIHITYSAKAEKEVTFKPVYVGWLSVDNGIELEPRYEHTVKEEKRFTDIVGDDRLDFKTGYLVFGDIWFFGGNVYLSRPSDSR